MSCPTEQSALPFTLRGLVRHLLLMLLKAGSAFEGELHTPLMAACQQVGGLLIEAGARVNAGSFASFHHLIPPSTSSTVASWGCCCCCCVTSETLMGPSTDPRPLLRGGAKMDPIDTGIYLRTPPGKQDYSGMPTPQVRLGDVRSRG